MSHDEDWDALLDAEQEVAALDEQHVFRTLGRINKLADQTVQTLPPDLQKPLLAIMDYAQEARRRLING